MRVFIDQPKIGIGVVRGCTGGARAPPVTSQGEKENFGRNLWG